MSHAAFSFDVSARPLPAQDAPDRLATRPAAVNAHATISTLRKLDISNPTIFLLTARIMLLGMREGAG